MKKIIFLTFLLTFPVFIAANTPANAQEENQIFITPGTQFENRGNQVRQFLKQQSFLQTNKQKPGKIQLSIVHPDFLEDDQFGIMMVSGGMGTDCNEYSQLEYEASYIENHYMNVNVKHFRVHKSDNPNPHYDCDMKNKIVTGMIIFSVEDLKKKNVRQIRFNNGQTTDNYNVAILPTGIRLTPASMVAFKAQGLEGPDKNYIEYRFADNHLVTLQVPMANQGEDITQAVRDLAYRSALEPVFEHQSLDTSGKNHVFYFRDPNGTTKDQMNEDGYVEFGTITTLRPYDGPEGRVGMPVPLKVFLTKPNVTL